MAQQQREEGGLAREALEEDMVAPLVVVYRVVSMAPPLSDLS